jgi:fatty-acyl-CoA synthase
LDDGRVFICGRSKEVVIVNGRNYYPQDMEWEAAKVDGVRKGNVIAFGARDPKGETDRERVVIAFEMQHDASSKDVATADTKKQEIVQAVRKAVQDGIGLLPDDVVALATGTLPKTSSGKLQRAKTRELYEAGDLVTRKNQRNLDRIDAVKQAAMSQLSYLKLAVVGGRKK